MVRIEDGIAIDAPTGDVWAAITDPAKHAAWHPFVTRIEGEHRFGATRTCSVVVRGKPGETKEQCVEEEAGSRITWLIEEDSSGFGRMVSEWRSGFGLEPRDAGTVVTAESEFRPANVVVRLLTPIVVRRFHHAQREILRGLKASIESGDDRLLLARR